MKFKAVLLGIEMSTPWQTFTPTLAEADKWGRNALAGLTDEQRKNAFVRVVELREVVVGEIRG